MSAPSRRQVPVAICLALALVFSACAPRPDAETAACRPANVSLTAEKDQAHTGTHALVDPLMEDFLATRQIPGAAVGIVVDDQIAYLGAYGLARVGAAHATGGNEPFTIGTPSAVGSVSKTVSALALLGLVEQGYVGLDDTVGMHLPGAPSSWADVTLRQLASHTSWLPRWPTWSYPSSEPELRAEFPGPHPGIHPRYAVTGTTTTQPIPIQDRPSHLDGVYSNLGYTVLGAVIDSVAVEHDLPAADGAGATQAGYETYAWWWVGMRGGALAEPTMTTLCLNAAWRSDGIQDLASGYRLDPAGSGFLPHTYQVDPPTGWEGPSGGWTMTIGDLTRLMLAIQTGAILGPAATSEMMQVHGQTDVGPYGLGVFRLTKLNRSVFMHGGNIDGYTARYTMWPNDGVGVAILVNRAQAEGENLLEGLSNDVAALFLE